MATIVEQLKKEISTRQAELEKLQAALEALTGSGAGKTKPAGTRKRRTPEQNAAQAERMKKVWEAKKASAKKK